MKNAKSSGVSRDEILTSSIYRKFIISYALMAIVPLLIFGYFVTVYIIPAYQTVENLFLITTLTVLLALIGFFMMRNILVSFLKLKRYAHDIAQEKIISISRDTSDQDLGEMVNSLNQIMVCLLQNQDELRHQKDKLQERYDENQRLGKSKEELVRMIAHDVKNFIMLISANVELLTSTSLDGYFQKRDKYLKGLKYSVMSLKHMIDNMLYIESMESGQTSFKPELLDLQGLSHECLLPMKLLIEAEGKNILYQVENTPGPVRVDRDLFSRVIWNLLWNADQHTSEGGFISLSVGTEPGGRNIFLSVTDDGEGIPKDIRDHIFEKFFQGNTSMGRRGAAGLGLAFCEIAVDLHGGLIDVESEEGRGSTFTVRLPAAEHCESSAS